MHVLTYPCTVDLVALRREIVEMRRMPVMGIYTNADDETCLVFIDDPSSDEKLILDAVVNRTTTRRPAQITYDMERRGV